MSERHHLDANVILRFLLADDPKQSPQARALFELAHAGKLTLCVSHVCLAEVTWVLHSFYKFDRSRLAQTLRELVLHDGVERRWWRSGSAGVGAWAAGSSGRR
jgi:predicted nucleic acid-binding protein